MALTNAGPLGGEIEDTSSAESLKTYLIGCLISGDKPEAIEKICTHANITDEVLIEAIKRPDANSIARAQVAWYLKGTASIRSLLEDQSLNLDLYCIWNLLTNPKAPEYTDEELSEILTKVRGNYDLLKLLSSVRSAKTKDQKPFNLLSKMF